MDDITAQLIGFVGTAILVVSYQQKSRKNLLLIQMGASAAFMTHFFLLGAYTGCIMNITGAMRAFIYANNDKKWARSPVWMVIFFIVFGLAGYLTADAASYWWVFPTSFNSYWWLLPTAAMLLSTVSFWLKTPTLVRTLTFPASPMWLTYNIASGSISGMVTESFVIISILVAIVRYDILKKKEVVAA
ncbi:MAG: YgjV family protein [Oscillospiraceae bacterium]|jgi:hypothetical protein|nr:YgjV family protein [Oscillospiraceae bacterium]